MRNFKRYTFCLLLIWVSFIGIAQDCDWKKVLKNELYASNEFLEIAKQDNGILETHRLLFNAGSKYVRSNPGYLKTFNKLSPDVQKLVAKFSDNEAGSTLTKFLDDCDADFIATLNKEENLVYVKGMLAHKGEEFIATDIEKLSEVIGNAEANKMTKWLNRSEKVSSFKEYTDLGKSLGTKIATATKDKSSKLFKELEAKIGVDLSNYDVLTEVPLVTENGFMKADIVLIKRSTDGLEDIEDVIVIENKLSQGTGFTPRQKEGFGAILNGETEMKVKYSKDGLSEKTTLKISKDKIYKIADHGMDSIDNLTIEKITNLN